MSQNEYLCSKGLKDKTKFVTREIMYKRNHVQEKSCTGEIMYRRNHVQEKSCTKCYLFNY